MESLYQTDRTVHLSRPLPLAKLCEQILGLAFENSNGNHSESNFSLAVNMTKYNSVCSDANKRTSRPIHVVLLLQHIEPSQKRSINGHLFIFVKNRTHGPLQSDSHSATPYIENKHTDSAALKIPRKTKLPNEKIEK